MFDKRREYPFLLITVSISSMIVEKKLFAIFGIMKPIVYRFPILKLLAAKLGT